MNTDICAIAASVQGKGSSRVWRNEESLHYYVSARTLTIRIGRFLGVNGTPLQRRLSQHAVVLFGFAAVLAVIVVVANRFMNNRVVIIDAVLTGMSHQT